jgi:plasmid replication initiation protein
MEEKKSQNIVILKQHNALTEARYEMSALEKNIVYMVMAQIKDNDDLLKTEFFISIQKLKDNLRELGEDVNLADIEEATDKLITRVYNFYDYAGNDVSMALFASTVYTRGSDLIEIEILSTARYYLFDLKYDFTSFLMLNALMLKSVYAKRIYEMLSQHKDEGVFLISVQELRDRLKLKEDKLSGWTDFQKTILESSTKEINEKTELSATYTLKKTGPKFTGIEFHIEKKEATGKESGKEAVQGELELGI